MTIVMDIACPECDRTDSVQKHGLDTYRCAECGHEFGHEDLDIA